MKGSGCPFKELEFTFTTAIVYEPFRRISRHNNDRHPFYENISLGQHVNRLKLPPAVSLPSSTP